MSASDYDVYRYSCCVLVLSSICWQNGHDDLGEYVRINQISDYFYKDLQAFFKGEYILKIKEYLKTQKHFFIKSESETFITAIIHRSFKNENEIDLDQNEKLEFLGDSVLQILISERLFQMYPEKTEGDLSKFRSALVNEQSLSKLGLSIELDQLILLGKGEFKEKGYLKPSILSDCFEAILGAIYLEGGLECAKEFLEESIKLSEIKFKNEFYRETLVTEYDAKSKLQELVMKKYKTNPQYECKEQNNNGKKEFHIQFKIEDKVIASKASNSKKKGMQVLAKEILENNLI